MVAFRNRNGKLQAQVRIKGHAQQKKSFASTRLAEFLSEQMRQRQPLTISSELMEDELGMASIDLKRVMNSRQCREYFGEGSEYVPRVLNRSKSKLLYDPYCSTPILERLNCAA